MKLAWDTKQIIKYTLLVLLLYFVLFRWPSNIGGWAKVCIMLLIVLLLDRCFRILERFINGKKGESDVGYVLKHLPKEYIHFSNLNLEGRGNIDYVLLGPSGIWIIEVKSHSGNIYFDGVELRRKGGGFEKDFLKQAFAEAYSLKNFIYQKTGKDFFVQPIIVFSNRKAFMRFGTNKIKGVYVVNLKWLSKVVEREGYFLKAGDVEVIYAAINKFIDGG